jgi:hypothetical protein
MKGSRKQLPSVQIPKQSIDLMSGIECNPATLLDVPLEMLTAVCHQLNLHDLVRIAETCKRLRHGEAGRETMELPTKSPAVTALREHAFPGRNLTQITGSVGCSESWVAYLARGARQRRWREAQPIAANHAPMLFVDAMGRLLACGAGATVGQGGENTAYVAIPMAAASGVRVRSVAAGDQYSLALSWDGRVYSWGNNDYGQLGSGDTLARPAPALMEELDRVCFIAAADCSFAVTQLGSVFSWGGDIRRGAPDSLRPIIVEGFEGVRVRRVCAGGAGAFAIGEDGECFSWCCGVLARLGHGNEENQPSPKRVEALRGVRVSAASFGAWHALALAEDGVVYAWGVNSGRTVLGNPHVQIELLPKPVEALRGVRVGNVAVAEFRSYAVADNGGLWA